MSNTERKTNKIAIVLREEHLGNPIQASIKLVADERGWDIYDIQYADNVLLDAYDLVIMYHNKPIKLRGKKTAWWMCDLRPHYLFTKVKYDHIFLCNKEHMEDYAKHFDAKVHYLPQCGDDRDEVKGRLIAKDLVFIGNLSSNYHINRLPIIYGIQDLGYTLELITGEQKTEDMKYIYRNAPFSLAISPQAKGYTSNRLYNILASGGFCITLYFKGIEDLFENKKHLVWFKDVKEIPDIIDYYYEHEDEYNAIKKAGKELYDNNHTAKHRLDNILENML